jgi:UDP-glucose 4-epimerase
MKKSHSKILVTGGAGYIGSHLVRQLGEAGVELIVLDNLYSGYSEAVSYGQLIVGSIHDKNLVTKLLKEFQIKEVIHLAAHTIVPESLENPLKYYSNNLFGTMELLECCQMANVERFIFSSTAAVYGIPESPVVSESLLCQPIHPYGKSKLMCEEILDDISKVSSLRFVNLRYFNVTGADPSARMGQRNANSTLLMNVAIQAALGKRSHVDVYGRDYPTPDGTCIRDYIHVEDIACAHLSALDYLRQGSDSITLNCGYGKGYSVLEILEAVKRVSGNNFEIKNEMPRAGDPASVIADTTKIHQTFNWKPQYNDLDIMVKTSLEWEKKCR